MWVKNQQIRAEKEGTDPKELDKMISAANEMVAVINITTQKNIPKTFVIVILIFKFSYSIYL